MNDNPLLGILKIGVTAVLAFLVWITFWQGLREERRGEDLKKEFALLRAQVQEQAKTVQGAQAAASQQAEATARLAGSVETMTALLQGGAFAAPTGERPGSSAPAASASAGARGPTATNPHREGADAPPARVTGRSLELWGRFEDFLTPDPQPVVYPALTTPGIDPNGRLTTWFMNAVSGLNPITKSDGLLRVRIMERCLESVVNRHVQNPDKYSPGLAVRVEHNPDYTEYVVWLRPDVRWQTPQVDLDRYPHLKGAHVVTAQDFKFTLDLILNSETDAGALRSYYSECSGIEVVDDFCYVMRWKKKQYNSLDFSLGSFYALPRFVFAYDEKGREYAPHEVGPAFNDHWFYRDSHFIGCGPYMMVSYDEATHCLLRRFDDYYDAKNVPPIREIYMEIFPDRNLQINKLLNGEHDYGGLLPKDWDRLKKEKGNPLSEGRLEENWVPSTQYGFIAWKNTHPIFKDLRVRRAMTLACDRPRVLETLNLGRGVNLSGPHYVHSPNCPKDLKPLPFDLEAAKALLKEAGWEDRNGDGVLDGTVDGQPRDFRFKAMIPNNPEWKGVWDIFKEDLAKIGVIVELEQLQWKQFSERLDARNFEATALYWDTSGWDDDLFQIWHSSQIREVPSSNFIEFQDAEVDRLIEEARVTFEPEARRAIQQRAHRRIAELQPYTFVNTIEAPVCTYKDRVGNVRAGLGYKIRPFARTFPMTVLAR